MSYIACDLTHGSRILVRKVLGKEHPCEVLMGVLEKVCRGCRLDTWQTVLNAVMNLHVRLK
jgi:hypothetical protein